MILTLNIIHGNINFHEITISEIHLLCFTWFGFIYLSVSKKIYSYTAEKLNKQERVLII